MKKILIAFGLAMFGFAILYASGNRENFYLETIAKCQSLNDMNLSAAIRRQAAPNRLPLTGYFQYTLDSQRAVKLYIANGAPIRTYFTIVGVPDGVDTTSFLNTAGWFDYADEREEALLILEPADKIWGAATEESAYVTKAITWLNSTQVNGTEVFSTFGEWYFVAYGKAAAPMEIWAANNPTRVIAQAYIDGPGADVAALTKAGSTVYGVGAQTPNGDSVGFNSAAVIRYNEMPVPTYYVTGDDAQIADSLTYWNTVNDVGPGSTTSPPAPPFGPPSEDKITTYKQRGNSARPATEYWNYKARNETVLSSLGIVSDTTAGIVKTVVYKPTAIDADYSSYTDDITDFLTWYTRYENTNGYANFLAPRADYSALGIQVREVGLGAAATNSARRQYSLYRPLGLGTDYPMLIVLPGNSQTNRVFMDATQWWYVAAKEKFLLVMLNEDYNNGWTTVSHYDTNLFVQKIVETLVDEFPVDRSRIYVTGQSMGSMATQQIGLDMPQYFGAIASTSAFTSSGPGDTVTGAKVPIPAFVMIGEGDMSQFAGGVWGDPSSSPKGVTLPAAGLGWANYHLTNWGLATVSGGTAPIISTADLTYYQSTITYGSSDKSHTYETWTWNLPSGIPVLRFGKTNDRPHNCYTSEMQQLWDFLKHYRVAGNGDRYYSASGNFADEVIINSNSAPQISSLAGAHIVSLQAFMAPTFYGEQLEKVEIIYEEIMNGLNLKPSDFHLYDRGSSNPDFAEITITRVQTNLKKVTLYVDTATDATSPASRNSLGHQSTATWFRDTTGQIYTGTADSGEYKANPLPSGPASRGYQTRKSLDLKLFYEGQTIADARCLAYGNGNYTDQDGWLPTDEGIFGKFRDLEAEVQLASSSGVAGDYIHAKYYIPNRPPASANGKYPLVVYLTGAGTSFWDWDKGLGETYPNITHNYGAVLTYDSVLAAWAQSVEDGGRPVIALGIHDRYATVDLEPMMTTARTPPFDYVEDEKKVIDYFVANFNADPDHIIFIGNSAGTFRSVDMNKRYPGLIDVFISCNGLFDRSMPTDDPGDDKMTSAQWEALARSGLAVWVLSGQRDVSIQHSALYVQQELDNVRRYYAAGGRNADWFEQNFRYTVFPGPIFRYWGEIDHSVIKVYSWHFFDNVYYGPYVLPGPARELGYSNKLNVGEKYTFDNIDSQAFGVGIWDGIPGFEYPVYGESVKDWALAYQKPGDAVDWND
jgi:poly(3-hydroxybutyrate) depolymerase